MKSPTAIRVILSLLSLSLFAEPARAQYILTNPGEYVALAEGNNLVNSEIKDETEKQMKTAMLQNTISAEFTKIKQWEKQYSSYLQTAEGYASSLKAATTIYNDGVRIFITLGKLKAAIADNPQGPVATLSMNNLYIETATELVTVFTLLKDAVAKGGKENMLTGAERSQTLQAPRVEQEVPAAVPFHQVLYHDRCMEQGHCRHHRPQLRRACRPEFQALAQGSQGSHPISLTLCE